MAASNYHRTDNFIPVYREGLQEFLHRRLYRLTIDDNLKRERLAQTCDTVGCVNPHHYRLTGDRLKGAPDHCPNGHPYTDENTTPSGHCRICAERRQARRVSRTAPDGGEINAAKTHCPQGHLYSKDNTYIYRTTAGVHRKCRTCARERAAAQRHPSLDTVTRPV
jgi:hypothetical protein